MKRAINILFVIFISAASVLAQDEGGIQKTEKGSYTLEMSLPGKQLGMGVNAVDVVVRDTAGKGVEGAAVTVTPWMPMMGHGVWEKPVVTERGGGNYHVENVVVIMSGLWALKTTVKKGLQEDQAAFTFAVAEKTNAPKEAEKPAGYERTVKSYNIPNVTLLNQDGKKVNLRSLLDSGKPVIVDFIFTTCTTICPVLSAGFSNLRTELGEDATKVQLVSITIDPEHDRPEQMKEYLSRFNGGEGWEFLTGSRDDIGRVLKAFDAFIVDKMSHEPLYILRAPNSDDWIRVKGLIKKSDLLREFKRVATK